MIDWDSDSWGNGVTYAANGSWVIDKHGDDDIDLIEASAMKARILKPKPARPLRAQPIDTRTPSGRALPY